MPVPLGFIIKNENDENENDTTLIQSNNEQKKISLRQRI